MNRVVKGRAIGFVAGAVLAASGILLLGCESDSRPGKSRVSKAVVSDSAVVVNDSGFAVEAPAVEVVVDELPEGIRFLRAEIDSVTAEQTEGQPYKKAYVHFQVERREVRKRIHGEKPGRLDYTVSPSCAVATPARYNNEANNGRVFVGARVPESCKTDVVTFHIDPKPATLFSESDYNNLFRGRDSAGMEETRRCLADRECRPDLEDQRDVEPFTFELDLR